MKFEELLKQFKTAIDDAVNSSNDLTDTEWNLIRSINIMFGNEISSKEYDPNPDLKKYKKKIEEMNMGKNIIIELFSALCDVRSHKESDKISADEIYFLRSFELLIEEYLRTKKIPKIEVSKPEKSLGMRYIDWVDDVAKYKYFVTPNGKIHQILKGQDCNVQPRNIGGYLIFNLKKDKPYRVDKLIWEAYNPEYRSMDYELEFIDNDPLNTALSNLRVKIAKPVEVL